MPVTQNSGYAPVILKNGNDAEGRRVSFTAQAAELHLVSVTNNAGAGTYSFRAVDTTVAGPRWSTTNGSDVQWALPNVSDMPVMGTFTFFDSNGIVIATAQVSIPSWARVVRYSGRSDLNLPRNVVGSFIFSHNDPPSSILAEAFMVNTAWSTPVPVKFDTVH